MSVLRGHISSKDGHLQKFISAPLRKVKVFLDERVPKHFTIVELSKNEEFIEKIKL